MITCTLTCGCTRAEASHRIYDALYHDYPHEAAESAAALLAERDLNRGIQKALAAAPELKLEWAEQEAAC